MCDIPSVVLGLLIGRRVGLKPHGRKLVDRGYGYVRAGGGCGQVKGWGLGVSRGGRGADEGVNDY